MSDPNNLWNAEAKYFQQLNSFVCFGWALTHAFIFAYSLMLSIHVYYVFEVNLLFSNYAQTISLLFSMRVHGLNGGPRVIIPFSRGEGFEASLLFSLV